MKSYQIKKYRDHFSVIPFLSHVFIDNHIVEYEDEKYTKSDIKAFLS